MYRKSQYNYKDNVMKEIIGTSVLTRYNNKTYRIDDIAWDKTPRYVFSKDDQVMSLVDYYKSHWNIEIKDLQQPLLVHRATTRTTTGEVCFMIFMHITIHIVDYVTRNLLLPSKNRLNTIERGKSNSSGAGIELCSRSY